jgi:hypothetical protein
VSTDTMNGTAHVNCAVSADDVMIANVSPSLL